MFPDLEQIELKEMSSYLQAGVHTVKVDSVKSSESIEGYLGNPYTEFKVSNENGIASLRLGGVDKTTSPAASNIRRKIFKEFVASAGVKDFKSWITACKSTIGATIEVCLANREYWTNDKDSGEPVIKTITDFKFSKRQGQYIEWLESYNKALKPSDMEAFKAARDAYIAASTTEAGVGESPF